MSSEVEKLVEKWDNDVLEYPFSEAGFAAKAGVRLCVDELRAAIAKDGERDRKLVEALLKIKKYYRTSTFSRRVAESALAAYDPQAQPKEGAK